MKALDRLDWRSGLCFSAYGVSAGIRTNDPAVLESVAALLPPSSASNDCGVVDHLLSLWIARPPARNGRRNYHLLYEGSTLVARTFDLEELWVALENHLTLLVAYWAQTDLVFVHAGVVGWKERAIVVPGRSHTGKTTLVAALLEAGADYYSDEMAVIDSAGLVHPYPVSLTLRDGRTRRRCGPGDLGYNIGVHPLPIAVVAITQYVEGAAWRPRRVSPGRTLMGLIDNTVAARRDPRSYLPILASVAQRSKAIKGIRGEAAPVASYLLSMLDDTNECSER